jgi:hypothetical protein
MPSRGAAEREREDGFSCTSCGEWHDHVPLAFHIRAPVGWSKDLETADGCELTSDLCVIRDDFFVHGRVVVPIVDRDELSFVWGVWTSLSAADFARTLQMWDEPGREESVDAMSAGLACNLPGFAESTLGLETTVRTQAVGVRPLVELEATDHPLAVEQREGITWAQVLARVERLMHRTG